MLILVTLSARRGNEVKKHGKINQNGKWIFASSKNKRLEMLENEREPKKTNHGGLF